MAVAASINGEHTEPKVVALSVDLRDPKLVDN
jgi:hypothetical protein